MKPRIAPLIGLALCLLAGACNRSGKDATAAVTSPAPVPPPPATVPPPSQPPPPQHPGGAEVEMFGRIKVPKSVGAKAKRIVYVADNDCLADDAHVLGTAEIKPTGEFFAEVTPKWGADLTVCAAVEPKPGASAIFYGKSDKTIHAEQTGEIVVKDLLITLERRPPHQFPAAPPAHVP